MAKNNKKRVSVSVTNDLSTDQRVHKVCSTLMQNNYIVKLIGRRHRNSPHLHRPYSIFRMRLLFNTGFLFYAEYNIRLFFYLLMSRADIYLANDTDTLTANWLASVLRRKPLVFDAHEMFPAVPEVVNRKFVKTVWTKIEDMLFPRLKHCYTVCQSIADIYNAKYGISMQVVRNIPPAAPIKLPKKNLTPEDKKVILYQGAVNMGRGIEWIIDAMPYLEDFVFFVVGDGDILDKLKAKTEAMHLQERVFFVGKVTFEELASYTQNADVGVNLLDNSSLNYYYSLPNRIFDYIRATLPIVSVDFPEIRRIVAHYQIGTLIDHFEPAYLANVIRQRATQPKNLSGFAHANAELTWENETQILLKVFASIESP
ncbi:MAG: glycosyltransferase [Bacteroidales bacterium]|nr:glycosyltransferase [Bacteroidales bacterium]